MQRTVHDTVITYANVTVNEDGTLNATKATATLHLKDTKKALKALEKKIGKFTPISVESVAQMYRIDDDIFFKYAVKVEGDESESDESESDESESDEPESDESES